jgi:hypothetical protein
MRKLLGTLTLAIIVLGAVGLYRGWFSLSSNSEENRTKIEVTVDKEKLKKDVDLVKGGVQNMTENMKSNPEEGSDAAADDNLNDRPILPPNN